MEIVFKNISNKIYKITVSTDESIESATNKLFEIADINRDLNTIKVIYKGRIVQPEEKISDFEITDSKDKLTFIFMTNKIKQPLISKPTSTTVTTPVTQTTSTTVTTQTTSTNVVTPTPVIPTISIPQENTQQFIPNNFDMPTESGMGINNDVLQILKGGVVGLFVFIKSHPQLNNLFVNDFETFINFMASEQAMPLIEGLLTYDNEAILQAQQNHQIQHQETPQQITMTQDDLNNVMLLESLGFTREDCIQAYISCGKNIDIAASYLMDMV